MPRSQSPAATTLLEGDTSADGVPATVFDAVSRPDGSNLLVVSYRSSPDAWLRDWRTRADDLPPEVGLVHVGDTTRSSAATASSATTDAGPAGRSPSLDADSSFAKAVSDPTDLGRVGVRASEYLASWEDNDRETVVLFDSVTAMLRSVALDRAFGFLHVLDGRVESVDGRGYYLLDPSAHDDRTLAVIRELADAAVDLDAARSAPSDSPR